MPPFRGFYEFSSLLFLCQKDLVTFIFVISLGHTYSYGYTYQTDWLSLYSELLVRGIIVHLISGLTQRRCSLNICSIKIEI